MNPSGTSPFRQAEERYFSLRGQLDTGRITRAQFDAAMADLMLRDAQGRYWAIGGDSGRWNVFQAGAWVEATPEGEPPLMLPGVQASPPVPSFSTPPPVPASVRTPPASPYTAAPVPAPVRTPPASPYAVAPAASPYPVSPAKSGGGGCGRTLGCGCLVLLVLLVACAGGAYFAVRSGALTTATFLNLAGLGPARIEVDNFSDDAISVNFLQTDTAKGSTPIQGSIQLNAFDVKTFHTPNAAKFRIDFATTAGRTSAGSCNLTVRSGDVFQFVALPDKILINRVNSPPQTGTDLVVQSSSLCR